MTLGNIKAWSLWHPKTTRFYGTYKDFKQSTQKLIRTSLIVGGFALLTFSLVDSTGWHWWHARSYIPNLAAGFTGFLIGAPVGLVILATFQAEREQSAIVKRINSLSEAAWDNFVEAFKAFYTDERMDATTITAMKAKSEHDATYKALVEFISFIRIGRPGAVEDPEETRTITDFYRQVQDRRQPFETTVNPITQALGLPETIETQWAALIGAWQTLDQYIRVQRLEQRLRWFDPEVDAELRKWLAHNPNPLTTFAEIHGYVAKTKSSADSMVDALNATANYSTLSEEELRSELSSTNHRKFGYSTVSNYEPAAKEASFFLERLSHCVERIINAEWPTSENVPQDDDP